MYQHPAYFTLQYSLLNEGNVQYTPVILDVWYSLRLIRGWTLLKECANQRETPSLRNAPLVQIQDQ